MYQPDVTDTGNDHASAPVATCQAPLFTRTSTRAMPDVASDADPPITTVVAAPPGFAITPTGSCTVDVGRSLSTTSPRRADASIRPPRGSTSSKKCRANGTWLSPPV